MADLNTQRESLAKGRFSQGLALGLVLQLVAAPFLPTAWAQEPAKPTPRPTELEQKTAQQHYQAGVMFFQAENWNAARAEFEAAYQLTKYPDLLYNLAKIAEKQGRTADEVRYLEEYLASKPQDSETVRARLAVIRPGVQAAGTTAGGTTSGSQASSLPWPAIGIAAGGVAFLIIGIACGGAALDAASTVASPTNNGKPFNADLFATQERGKQLSAAAIAFDVMGGLALAAGGGWIGYWVYQRQQQKKLAAPPMTALVPFGPGGPGVGVVGSF